LKDTVNEIARLEQKEAFRGARSFVLRDDGTLVAEYRSLGKGSSHTVQLASLDPNPRREQHREVGLLIVFVLFTLALLGTAFGAIAAEDEATRFAYMVAGIPLLVLALVSGVAFRRKSFDLVIYDSPYTGEGILMCNEKPTREVFGSFIERLQEQVQEHRSTTLRDGGIADHLRSLAKLRDEGILTEEEFATAKERVISGNDPRGPIGFAR
jgi:Short C-terminal domain